MAVEPHIVGNVADFRFRISGFESGDLRVTAFAGTEGVSQLFNIRVRLCTEEFDIDPEALLGQSAALEIDGEHGTRIIHGIVRSFGRIGQGSSLAHYEAQLVAPHWLLTRRIQSRVFNEKRCQRMDVIGIVGKVLADAGMTKDDWKVAIARQYEPREFVVQYRESDWDFIARLLEEEGIYYFFKHDAERCRLVLMDSKDLHEPYAEVGPDVPFRSTSGLVEEREYIYAAESHSAMQIGTVTLDDFYFRQPGQELRLNARAAKFTNLLMTDYPGGYQETERGRRLVDTRLEERQCERRLVNLAGTVRGFWPGSRFTLAEHPDERINAEYMITSMTHRATQSQSGEEEAGAEPGCRYEVDVRAIPATVQFRAPRSTPCPTVLGSQTALVVGPPSEEIHTDEYGRVEVRFHWDQEWDHDVGASCWVRVSQGWAGGQYGMMFLPRVGQEVMVDFLEGNPDQPIITGRIYNKDQMPPYRLPDQKTISTIRTCSSPGAEGGNEIRFDDKKGGEQLLLFAQNALHTRAQGNRFENVGGDSHETIRGDAFELAKKNKHSTVTLDHVEEVNGSKQLTVGGNVRDWLWGKKETIVHGRYLLQNRDGGIVLHSAKSITLFAGGNFIKIDESGVSIVGKLVKINSGDSAPYWGDYADGLPVKLPIPADTTQFGHNVRYTHEGVLTGGREPDETKKETSWIEIELIDEAGRPVPHEAYAVILPDGKKIGGTLDGFGRAHVAVPDPGLCQITFPRLDAAAWEAIG